MLLPAPRRPQPAWLPLTHEITGSVVGAFKRLPSDVYLRTAAAVHLQCAATNNIKEVYTNDRHMLSAGFQFGENVSNVIGER